MVLKYCINNFKYLYGEYNCVKIYCDNGGSFYEYKINDEFVNCKPLLDKLHKYQITNDLTDKILDMNCVTYALQQSGKFDQKTIDNIKVESFIRYVSHKDLEKLCEQFHIAFKVVKMRSDNDKIEDITRGRKIIGSSIDNATLIELALIDKHYILNESVNGVSSYALQHYNKSNKIVQINQKTGY